MASYNRIILMGNLTRDPELTYTPSGMAVCKFGMATNHRRKDAQGNVKEEVCFVDCTLFGKGGEIFKQYMAKGKSALVEGRLDYQTWQAQDGTKRSKHAVIVDNFQFLGGRGEGGAGGGYNQDADASSHAPANAFPAASGGGGQRGGYDEPPQDDAIPF